MTNPGACSMQKNALIRFADGVEIADFMGAPPVHVAQRDHLTLCEREIRNRFLDMAADLVGQDALLGCPCSRRQQPRSSERMIRRMESRCIDIRGAHLVIATFP